MHIFLLTLVLMSPSHATADAERNHQFTPEFERAIAYEYRTCQMTYLMTKKLAEDTDGDAAALWTAYYSLYDFNRSLYEPLAETFGVSNNPGRITRFRGWISAVAGKWFPGITISATNRLANKYVEKLRHMRDIGPVEHREFLDYIVRMEELQIDFLADAVEGDYRSAKSKVDKFLEANEKLRSRLLRE